MLALLGAELVLTPGPGGMRGAVAKAEELKAEASSGRKGSRKAKDEVACLDALGKALGLPEDLIGTLSSQVWAWSEDGVPETLLRELNLNPADRRLRLTLDLAARLRGSADHLIVPQQAGNLIGQRTARSGVHRRLLVALDLARHRSRGLAPVAPLQQRDAIMDGGEAVCLGDGVDGEDHRRTP